MKSRAFTLIELLVVIAIIAILSAIVLASLNSARERGREAAIRSTLKSMSQQIELMRNDNADYRFVNTCANAGDPLKKFVDALNDQGATVACNSFASVTDVYSRWGVTAEMVGAADLTAFSASPKGVVKWDTADAKADGSPGSQFLTWDTANAACALSGKRLPTAEQLISLNNVNHPIPNFILNEYWSDTEVPGNSAAAYAVVTSTGGNSAPPRAKGGGRYVRCVS